MNASTWTYVAATMKSTEIKIFANGVNVFNCTGSATLPDVNAPMTIGKWPPGTAVPPFNGTIDEVRVSSGVRTNDYFQAVFGAINGTIQNTTYGINDTANSSSSPVPSGVTYNLTYDANGNRASGFNLTHEYNNFNQLVRVRQGNSTGSIVEEYLYDESGNRIQKFEPQKNQTTYYFDKSFVRVFNSSGTFDTVYYYDSHDLVGRKELWNNRTFFYHPDHLSSNTLITNETGQVVEETTYEPYGNVFSGGNDRYLYTGKEKDTGTGLEYYGARYYDPTYAQFTQPDTVISDIYDPQSLNPYSYVWNNPYRYVDPSGNVAQLAGGFIAGAIVGWAVGALVSTVTQYFSTGKVDPKTVRNNAAATSVAGAIGGLTAGSGLTSVLSSGVIAGQAARATSNLIQGQSITQGLGNPMDMAMDAGTAGITNRLIPYAGSKISEKFSSSAITSQDISKLPTEAENTLNLINKGGHFPFKEDGSVFRNKEGLLPSQSSGYYREYTIPTPGAVDRGQQRFVVGQGGEVYYTNDHYGSFVKIGGKSK